MGQFDGGGSVRALADDAEIRFCIEELDQSRADVVVIIDDYDSHQPGSSPCGGPGGRIAWWR
ncbi:hypothetical protein GCM10009609_45200 [Pseudonocardia aurantiaca]